jgi:hypothetical protein
MVPPKIPNYQDKWIISLQYLAIAIFYQLAGQGDKRSAIHPNGIISVDDAMRIHPA